MFDFMHEKFRKKFTLALLIWAAGTALAIYTKAPLTDYTMFSGTLLAIFGTQDIAQQGAFKGLKKADQPDRNLS